MPPDSTWLLCALCVGVAAIIRSLTGFGFAAIAVVGLSLLLSLKTAVPLVLALEVVSGLLLAPGVWPSVERPLLWRLLLAAAMGVPIGSLALRGVDAYVLTLCVYLLIATLALMGLARKSLPAGKGAWSLWPVGISTGALIAAFSIGGPLLVAWLSHRGLRPAAVRATLVLFFLLADVLALLALQGTVGIPLSTWASAVGLLPPLLLGLWLGQKLYMRVPANQAARATQWLLLALAVLGLLSTARLGA